MVNPVKLLHVLNNQDLQEFDSADEQFLSYQAGLGLCLLDSSVPGVLSTDSAGGGTLIGTHNNTFYEQPVGTHPGSALSIGTVSTSLYQDMTLTVSEIDSDFHNPIRLEDSDISVHEAKDSDLTIVSDRILTYIFTNEYPGCYRLDSAPPSADWAPFINNVFSDTRADGHNAIYSIYRRNALTGAPSQVLPLKIKYTGDSAGGSYEGIQELSNAEMQTTFGKRVANRISVTGIGEYQLRTSAQGAPVDPGTWTARGVAYDTRNTTQETTFPEGVHYVGGYDALFEKNPSQQYTATYERDFISDYVLQEWAAPYTQTYVAFVGYTSAVTYQTTYIQDIYVSSQLDRENYQLDLFYQGTVNYIAFINYIVEPLVYTSGLQNYITDGGTYQTYVHDRVYTGPSTNYTGLGEFIGIEDYLGAGTVQFSQSYQGTYMGWVGIDAWIGVGAWYGNTYTSPAGSYTQSWLGDIERPYEGLFYTGAWTGLGYYQSSPTFISETNLQAYAGEDYALTEIYTTGLVYTNQYIQYILLNNYLGPGPVGYSRDPLENIVSYSGFVGPQTDFVADYVTYLKESYTGYLGIFINQLSYDIDYLITYLGVEFIGTQLITSTETLETWTLYCRVE